MFQGKTKRGVDVRQLDGVQAKTQNRCWLVVGDRSRIRIFEKQKTLEGTTGMIAVGEIASENGRTKGHDLVSDRPGRSFQSSSRAHHGQSGALRHALSSHETPSEHELDKFIQEGAEYLQAAWQQKKFDSLHLYAEPHFMGKLRAQLGDALDAVITRAEEKDYAWLAGPDLEERLKK